MAYALVNLETAHLLEIIFYTDAEICFACANLRERIENGLILAVIVNINSTSFTATSMREDVC